MTIRLLAIDTGSNCGYSVLDVMQPIPPGTKAMRATSGVWDLHQKRFEGPGMRLVRLRNFITEVKPDFVVYEQVNFRQKSMDAERLYGAIIGCISMWGDDNKIEVAAIDTSAIKMRATGKGGGKGTDKTAMVQAANKFFDMGGNPLSDLDAPSNKDHNISDAMWLMQICIEELAGGVKKKE